jgi:prephenate dehydratase
VASQPWKPPSFSTRNVPGAIPLLSALALRDLNLVKIESRLRGKPWEYLFI